MSNGGSVTNTVTTSLSKENKSRRFKRLPNEQIHQVFYTILLGPKDSASDGCEFDSRSGPYAAKMFSFSSYFAGTWSSSNPRVSDIQQILVTSGMMKLLVLRVLQQLQSRLLTSIR